MNTETAIIILAAGKGKRMNSDIPKVLHKLDNTTLIDRVIQTSRSLGCSKIIVVVGHQKEKLKEALKKHSDIEYAIQEEQKGTAHAVKMCFNNLENFSGNVIILSGDVPLIDLLTLEKLLDIKDKINAKASVLTADIENPDGYGRIIRDNNGLLKKIVEHKDCNNNELLINEINAGIYIVDNNCLFDYIPKIGNQNAQSEYYLPDLINLMIKDKQLASVYKTNNIVEISGVNSKEQLNELEKYLKNNG